MKMKMLLSSLGVAGLAGIFCGPAMAIPCTGVNVGTSVSSDVTLHGTNSTQCEIASGNSGMAGGNSGLIPTDGAFAPGGSWTQIGSEGVVQHSGAVPGLTFTGFSFTGGTALNGTWGVSWTGTGGVDLLFSMHAGGFSGFFVFSDLFLPSNASWTGTWLIDWLNNGGQHPAESNWQVWVRADNDVPGGGVGNSIPEPESLALLGLGLVAFSAARRRRT